MKLDREKSLEITQFIKDNKTSDITWSQMSEKVSKVFNVPMNKEQVRSRYRKTLKTAQHSMAPTAAEYEHHFSNGIVELNKNVFFDENDPKTDKDILRLLGYDVETWEVVEWRIGEWDTSMKGTDGEPVKSRNKTIRAKIKPRRNSDVTFKEAAEAYETLIRDIGVFDTHKHEPLIGLNAGLLKELTGIELHLGKMAWSGDTGSDYNKEVATERFERIVDDVISQQEIEQAADCLYCIGNDFFNSDTVAGTTTKGTPQYNDMRWKQMFLVGQELNIKLINTLLDNYENVHVRLQSGNHDMMAAFYLYTNMQQYYRNEPRVDFSTDYKDVQCFLWGRCSIFFTHGDSNLKRTMQSIPSEFYKEWGQTVFRELHLGHLHKEVVVDDESGLITRRVGSPSGTDNWHYGERFVGATQKYQTFLWDQERGLKSIQYINFG